MDIYKILNINPGIFTDFPILANRVADYQTEKVVNHNIDKLMQIKNKMLAGEGIQVNQQSIDSIISKAKSAAKKQDYDISHWSIRELRIISYYLMELKSNPEYYFYALNLLETNWRDLYFNGILFYLMNSWNSIEKEFRERTCKMVCNKLSHYNGTNRRYINLKNHVNFLEENGPTRMATLVYTQHKKITEAPQILGFKSSTINQSYYSDVILKCIKLYNIDDFDLINQIFELHNLDRTKKLVLAHLVEKAEYEKDGVKQSALCRYINRTLGDVTLPATWAPFIGATKEEANSLKRAMQLVNIWFTQQFIETFFEECVQDKSRERFWLNYLPYISKFKIVGSTAIKRLLQSNRKIGTIFSKHFIQTNSYSSQTSALVLFIKDKVMVEFSDTGALYVYNQNHPQVKLITRKINSLSSTNDLKDTAMMSLIEPNEWRDFYYRDEGRMTHRGDWQTRLNGWMFEKVISNHNYESATDSQIDKIFDIQEPIKTTEAKDISIHKDRELSETDRANSIATDFKEEDSKESKRQQADSQEEDSPFMKKVKAYLNDVREEFKKNHPDFYISSKWLSNGSRIVANKDAFYVYNPIVNDYIKLKEHSFQNKLGSIWIRKTYLENWFEIVHFYIGTETLIGYISPRPTEVIYKEDLSDSQKRKIKFE